MTDRATYTGSISDSLSATLSASVQTPGHHVKLREVLLSSRKPTFSTLPAESALRYRLIRPTDISSLIDALTDTCLEFSPDSVLASVKIAAQPFAKGAMKAAYRAFDCALGREMVLKESMAVSDSQRTLAKYEAFLSCHHAASFLAAEFEKMKPADCEAVKFCNACVLHLPDRDGQPYFIEEEQLAGQFEKFNNNSGLCMPFPTAHGTMHQAVQAFSHWTHSMTGGAMMVVDCQGTYAADTKTFKLTDPAIHATALTRFGGTNLGAKGFVRFYKTHVCNDYCKALGLTLPAMFVPTAGDSK